ncbi:MAG: DUF5911 domain-containing protein [Desulfovibrio sp.]|nr:DUF5911 domain-containing protein [Desulfovibrio sp.]
MSRHATLVRINFNHANSSEFVMPDLDYGVIGNCRTAALVSKSGDIRWLCLPDFDSAAVFASILDAEKGGHFGFSLSGKHSCSQSYIAQTNILRTLLFSENGVAEVLDFMPRYRVSDSDYHMPPEVYRLLRPLSGKPRLGVVYAPALNYAKEAVRHEKRDGCVLSHSLCNANNNIYLYSSLDLDAVLEGREFTLDNDEFLLLSYHQKLVDISLEYVNLELERTKVYWLNWSQRSVRHKKYREPISRSLLVLKLMTFEQTGAILAALTTSIPETIGGERNWDYRYCWLRDASMSMVTLLEMGHPNDARRFLRFIRRILRSKQDSFQVMYGIRGERVLTEERLSHLAGFENSRPVRVGNAAYAQKQNDSFGYLLDVMYNYYRFFGGSPDDIEELWEIVKKIISTVLEDWRNSDHSIWEFRSRKDHFVFSKVMCWVALDRGAKIAEFLGCGDERAIFAAEAEAIRNEVFAKGWSEELQSFSQAYGSAEVDASLLLMEQYGFVSANDERYVKTVDRVKEKLFHKGLMYRYRNDDDFGRPESAFTICTFWFARALYVTGRKEEALAVFDDVLAHCNHVGLFSEDLDFETKGQLGNFPQAYSHLALIETASLLNEGEGCPSLHRAPQPVS